MYDLLLPGINRSVDFAQPVTRDPRNKGLLGWWMLLPGSNRGATLSDLRYRNHGLLVSKPTYAGPLGRRGGHGSLLFVGASSQYVTMGDPADGRLDIAGAFSLSCWFRTTTTTGSFIVNKKSNGGNGYEILYAAGGVLTPRIQGPSAAIKTGTTWSGTNDGAWHWVMMSWDGSTNLRTYGDGALIGSTSVGATGSLENSTAFQLGARDGTSAPFTGAVDDVRLYDRDFLPDEAARLYEESLAGYPHCLSWVNTVFYVFMPGTNFTGVGAVTLGGVDVAGSATHTTPSFTASAGITVGGVEVAGSATNTTPTYTGAGAVTLAGVEIAGSATHATPTFTASAGITVGGVDVAGSATHTAPIFTASAAITLAGVDVAGTAAFASAIFQGSLALTLGGVDVAGSATFTAPTYDGTSSVTLGGVEVAGSGTHTAPSFTASAAVTLGGVEVTGAANFGAAIRTATAVLTLSGIAADGSATFTTPVFTGVGAVILGGVEAAGSEILFAPSVTIRAGAATLRMALRPTEASIR